MTRGVQASEPLDGLLHGGLGLGSVGDVCFHDQRGAAHFLDLGRESLESVAAAGQSFLTYTAEPGSPSQDALNLLASWAATTDDIAKASTDGDPKQAESFQMPD